MLYDGPMTIFFVNFEYWDISASLWQKAYIFSIQGIGKTPQQPLAIKRFLEWIFSTSDVATRDILSWKFSTTCWRMVLHKRQHWSLKSEQSFSTSTSLLTAERTSSCNRYVVEILGKPLLLNYVLRLIFCIFIYQAKGCLQLGPLRVPGWHVVSSLLHRKHNVLGVCKTPKWEAAIYHFLSGCVTHYSLNFITGTSCTPHLILSLLTHLQRRQNYQIVGKTSWHSKMNIRLAKVC